VGLDFSGVGKSTILVDERGRLIRFPSRRDYLDFLVRERLIADEKDFIDCRELNEEVYLDWLRRGQVGCMFAQLLARPYNRLRLRTVVLREATNSQQAKALAEQIDVAVRDAVTDTNVESVSILLPTVLTPEDLVNLILYLSALP